MIQDPGYLLNIDILQITTWICENFLRCVPPLFCYHLITVYIYIHSVLKNYVYNVSGMIEEVKTNMFFIWQNFGLCTVFPLDGLTGRWLNFRHNTHRLVLFVLLCLQQVERVITVSTKTCYDKYSKYVMFTIHSRATAYLQCWNVFTFVLNGGFHLL